MSATPLHDPTAAPLSDAKVEIRNTTCYMCACRCGIRVHLRNGEVRYIEGNPDHPLNQGVICAKGSSGIMKQYSPARLTKPLLRKIENAIIDKNARIGNNVTITPAGKPENFDHPLYFIRDGIVVIPKGASIPHDTVI